MSSLWIIIKICFLEKGLNIHEQRKLNKSKGTMYQFQIMSILAYSTSTHYDDKLNKATLIMYILHVQVYFFVYNFSAL